MAQMRGGADATTGDAVADDERREARGRRRLERTWLYVTVADD
jgi:hypothetical protein